MIHKIKSRVFCKNEDCDKIKESLIKLFPFEIKKQLSESYADGYHGDRIKIFEVNLEKRKEIKLFIDELKTKVDFSKLYEKIENLIDDDLNLILRLDKSRLLDEKYKWVFSGDCFYFKFTILTFPKRREEVIEVVRKLFKE